MVFETEPRMIQLFTRAQVTGRPLIFERSRANCATDPRWRMSCAIDLRSERARARIVFANFFVIVPLPKLVAKSHATSEFCYRRARRAVKNRTASVKTIDCVEQGASLGEPGGVSDEHEHSTAMTTSERV
jgi:hypothetical protein